MPLTPIFVSLFPSPVAVRLSLSNIASPSSLLLPYSPLAPVYYHSHLNLPISLRIPN